MTKEMTQAARAELTNAIRGRYKVAVGKAKRRILEEFIAATGYHEKSVELPSQTTPPVTYSMRHPVTKLREATRGG
jgi:hypothetical protein